MRRRDMRTWHITPKEGWYGAVGRAKQSQSAMVAGIEALEQGCKWWLRTLQQQQQQGLRHERCWWTEHLSVLQCVWCERCGELCYTDMHIEYARYRHGTVLVTGHFRGRSRGSNERYG
jgi:ferredoxin